MASQPGSRQEEPAPHGASRARAAWLAALVAALTIACFLPVLAAGFVNFDDDRTVTGNAHLAFDGASLAWMFRSFHMGHYQPLTWLSLAADRAAWGGDPRGFHATNLALHALSAVLCFLLARALLASGRAGHGLATDLSAALAALAFAIHPLRVESVAWVSERRDVLSGVCFLGALLVFVRAAERGSGGGRAARGSLPLVVALQLLSLLAKAWAVSLPLVLLVLDVWPLRRWQLSRTDRPLRRRLLAELLATGVPAFAFLVLAGFAQRAAGVARSWEQHGLLARALQACYGLCFYPWKTLLPTGLLPLYPLGARLDVHATRFAVAVAVVALLAVALWLARRRLPALAAAALGYACVVAPVLGFWQSGPQLVADRYSYLACLPFALLAGAGALTLCRRADDARAADDMSPARAARPGRRRGVSLLGALLVLLVAVLGPLTFAQCRTWHDSIALWTPAVAAAPDDCFARYQLGKALLDAGRAEEAVPHLLVAVEHAPPDREGRLAVLQTAAAALATAGRFDEAFPLWDAVLLLDPRNVDVLADLGNAHSLRGEHAAALACYERAAAACSGTVPAGELDPSREDDRDEAPGARAARAASCARAAALLQAERAR